jgi:transposase
LRQRIASVTTAWKKQSSKADRLEEQLKTARAQVRQLQEENKKLKDEVKTLNGQLSSVSAHKDKLAGMIFKTNVKSSGKGTGRKRGGQRGHKGHYRKQPAHIDREVDAYLTNCTTCNNELSQSNAVDDRLVEDIPVPQIVATLYHIQRQWCGHCQKEVSAVPPGTIPGFRFGLNLLLVMLTLKYRLRTPLARIREFLRHHYGFAVTEGGIQGILHRLKERFTPQYQQILKEIRKTKVKHADETSWRIEGQNAWVWLFATQKAAYYTIEETRGKGVPDWVLKGSAPGSVLVRDEYAVYRKQPMEQQSCWTHTLRVSRDAAGRPDASAEVSALHAELKAMFADVEMVIARPFMTAERRSAFVRLQEQLTEIEARPYAHRDAQAVQTRIRNQHANLLTAVLHEDVPLTNNHAERQIRPMVVTRKISGGSRSPQGAATHAVNMSVLQTIALKGKPLMAELKKLLTLPEHRYALLKTE